MDGYGGEDGGYGGGMGGYGGDDYGGYGGGEDTEPAGPAFTLLDDVAGVDKFVKDEDTEPAVVGIFNGDTNQADIEAFEAFANEHRSVCHTRVISGRVENLRGHNRAGLPAVASLPWPSVDTSRASVHAPDPAPGPCHRYDMRFAYSVKDDVRAHFKASSG